MLRFGDSDLRFSGDGCLASRQRGYQGIASGQGSRDLQRGNRTLLRIIFQTAKDHAFEQGVEIADQRQRIGNCPGLALLYQFRERGGLEDTLSSQDFVEKSIRANRYRFWW